MQFALSDEVADRGRGDHDFESGNTPAYFFLQQGLSDDCFQGFCDLCANLGLLVWGKSVDDAVDGLRRAGGVECTKDQVACFCSSQRELDGFQVAHFAHEDNVRIFSEGGSQCVRERQGMDAHLPLVHEAFFCFVDKLDRIFDRDDVALERVVQVIDHGCQRRRFTRSGWAGHKDQSFFPIAELSHDWRQAELFHRNDLGGNVSEDGAKPTVLDEDIDAESGDVA